MRSQEGPASVGRARKPFPQRRSDPRELRGAPRDRDDRDPELLVERVQVENVEPAHDRAVHENRADAFERSEAADERDDPTRPVRAVDPDPAGSYCLYMFGERQDHGRDRSVPVPARERSVVDPDHPRMRFPEGPPQR
jgi:hypothetical protein